MSHIRSTQERLCDDKIETRLKQNQEVKEQCEDQTKKSNARRSQSAVMKKKREHEDRCRSVRSRQSVQTSRGSAENITCFFVKFSAIVFNDV